MATYQYQPLQNPQEIRLLVLAPGKGFDKIYCRVEHVDLPGGTKFEALSYAWGEPIKTSEILCDGKPLPVTENLFQALRHLRHEAEERLIWADAVCIDQSNDLEKNHQLALMGKIYSQARKTLVWIGEDREGQADAAFKFTSEIYSYLLKNPTEFNMRLIFHKITKTEQEKDLWDWIRRFVDAVGPIFKKSWFTRLWVVQEVALARYSQLVFGDKTFPMHQFLIAVFLMGTLEGVHEIEEGLDFDAFSNVINICRILRKLHNSATHHLGIQYPVILQLLRHTQRFLHTDPRDRIFALLGLASDSGFQADYTLSVTDTFINFAKWALHAAPDFAMLSHAQGASESRWCLPSWAPSPDLDIETYTLLRGMHFQASGQKTGQERFSAEKQTWFTDSSYHLLLRGRIVDRIADILQFDAEAMGEESRREFLLKCAQFAGVSHFDKNPDNDCYYRFCFAMMFGLDPYHYRERVQPEQIRQFHKHFQDLEKGDDYRWGDLEMKEMVARANIDTMLYNLAETRTFCRTASGRMAWVNVDAKLHDCICIIQGARLPYTLSSQSDGNFQLVGECWIEGLMEGEALNLPGFEWEDIVLV